MLPNCIRCGVAFERNQTRGRPRLLCDVCRPEPREPRARVTECVGCGADITRRSVKTGVTCLDGWGCPYIAAKLAAHRAVWRAVHSGAMPPAFAYFCVDCGADAHEYDHRDYNRPLDVDPVCRSCNRRRGTSAPIREAANA